METDIQVILQDAGLATLVEVFNANDIDLDVAKELTEGEIRELIPSIGQRKKFQNIISKFKNNEDLLIISDIQEFEILGDNTLAEIQSESPGTPSSTSSSMVSGASNVQEEIVYAKTKNAAIATLPEFDLKTLLGTTPLGLTILNFYKANQTLNSSKRQLLVDIVVKKIFDFITTHRMAHSDYNVLTAKICMLFPTECSGTYYVPAISKRNSITNKPIVAKGKLVDKVRNILRISREFSLDKKTETSQKIYYNENLKSDKIWLDVRNEPWEEVMQRWTLTYEMRRSCSMKTVQEFFNDWPILKDPRANVLIDMDYDLMYPESITNIFVNWFPTMEKLINLKKDSIKDQEAFNYLELLEQSECSEGTKVALHLSLLPHLIPPKSRITLPNKKHWKFSTAEVIESMLLQAKVPGDIQQTMQEYSGKMYSRGQSVQPYILIEGNIHEVKNIYVVVDKLQYKCDNLLKAIDLIFKIFHICNACYPKQSEYLWILIQKTIYKFSTPQDSVIPYMMDIIERLI